MILRAIPRCATLALGVFCVTSRATEQKPLRPGDSSGSPFTDDFASLVDEIREEWHIPGLALSVVDGDETYSEGYGFATLPDVAATPDTLWYVGSTTKAHLTATLAQIIASGNSSASFPLGWQTPISSIIHDDFVLQDPWSMAHLTLEDAASHRTGMTRHDLSVEYDEDDHENIVRDTVRNMRNLPVHIEPRTEFHYNNLMYTVLTHVAQTVTGEWLGDLMKKTIWEPLGMSSTYYDLQDARDGPNHVSHGYWVDDDSEFHLFPYVPSSAMNGAGAVISSVKDYAKWMRCLINKDEPLLEAAHEEIRRPRIVQSSEPVMGADLTTYSLSWFRTTLYGRTVYWHSGSTMTHVALVYFFPEEGYGVTIFANTMARAIQALMYRLIEDRFDVPESQRFDVQAALREGEKERDEMLKNATNIAYPDRPSEPLPPSLPLQAYAGTYKNVGYGTVILEKNDHPDKGEKGLIGAVVGREWPATVKLEHVTGEFWITYIFVEGGPPTPETFFKVEFKIGSDGKVAQLDLHLFDRAENVFEGVIGFVKQD